MLEMKKVFVKLLTLCMAMMMMTACGSSTPAEEETSELILTFDAYSIFDMAMVTYEMEGLKEETGSIDFIAMPGETVTEVLENSGISVTGVYSENETFEGWMEYETVITTDADGFDTIEYVKVSDELYTLEEVLEKTVEHNVCFTAKWAEHGTEEYYAEEF